MKLRALAFAILLATVFMSPAIAEAQTRYGYIGVKAIEIELQDANATLYIDYELDLPARFLVYILGNADLKNKLARIVNYENATLREVDMNHAVFVLHGEVIDYGDGAYWFGPHRFNIVTPSLTVTTPQTRLTFRYTDSLPRGVGYFRTERGELSARSVSPAYTP